MLTSITIKRVSGTVIFETVSINVTDLVFFINLDTDPDPSKSTHWPKICDEEIDPTSSPPNSSKCLVPTPDDLNPPNNKVTYTCNMDGHGNETGVINVFAVLAAVFDKNQKPPPPPIVLLPGNKDHPIKEQQLVAGGMSPYVISGKLFEVTADNGKVIQPASDNGWGLQLNAKTDNTGITVSGTPTLSGTYNFTLTVDDGMGGNLQQVQYSMVVV